MTYELVYILTPKISEKEVKDKNKEVLEVLKKVGAEVLKEDFWGKKELAYPIKNFDQGFYTLVKFQVEPEKIKEIDKSLKLQEEVIRFLMIKKEEKAQAIEEKMPIKLTEKKEKVEIPKEAELEKLDKELEEILGKKEEI